MNLPVKAMVAICASCVVLGAVAFYLLAVAVSRLAKRKKKSRPAHKTERKGIIERIGVMNLILVIIGVTLFWFTNEMISLFKIYGAIPDTLVNCVFLLLGGECGVMGWIKTNKEKYRDRKWQKEDEASASSSIAPPADGPSKG